MDSCFLYTKDELELAAKIRNEVSLHQYIALINDYFPIYDALNKPLKNNLSKDQLENINHLVDELDFVFRIDNFAFVVYLIAKKKKITIKELLVKANCNKELIDSLNNCCCVKYEYEDIKKICNAYGLLEILPNWYNQQRSYPA